MKSVCIKTNNQKSIDYLLRKLEFFPLENIYYSCKKFSKYNNVIIHYVGNQNSVFLQDLSKLLTHLVTQIYEFDIIQNIIQNEYFYFNIAERNIILNSTTQNLSSTEEAVISREEIEDLIFNDFYEFLTNGHSLVLHGFIAFRLKNYLEVLEAQIDKSVNSFIVEREYSEFITLLKLYINSEDSAIDVVHLIYNNSKAILLDANKNIIPIQEIFNAKYLSDITFSANDYAFNTLLSLLPKKLYIHLIDNNVDEFISTLKLIFEDRISFCTDCSICKIYQSHALIWFCCNLGFVGLLFGGLSYNHKYRSFYIYGYIFFGAYI